MNAKVLGIQKLDFVTADGNKVKGTKLHCAFRDDNVEGAAVDSFFINTDNVAFKLPDGISSNCEVEISFNRKGRVDNVRLLSNPVAKA